MKFKIGDWVRVVGQKDIEIVNNKNVSIFNNPKKSIFFKHWQPKEGDVCWFYDSYMSHAILGKYGDECNFWDSVYFLRKEHFTVEPYIQNALPSTLR